VRRQGIVSITVWVSVTLDGDMVVVGGVGGVGMGVGVMGAETGARANTIGRANADTTIPVVRNQASSRHGLELRESSAYRLAMKVGMGDRR